MRTKLQNASYGYQKERGYKIMFGLGMPELLIILAIIVIVFGAGKLPGIGGALGQGIKNFKNATRETEEIEVKPRSGGED